MQILVALTLLVLCGGALTSPSSDAPPPPAQVRAVAGDVASLVQQGRFDEAIDVLDRAESSGSSSVYVYMRAVVEERRGDCDRAVKLYREYLSLDVPPQDAAEAERGLERCGAPTAAPEPEPEPEAATVAPVDEGPPARADDRPRRWYADPAGGVVTITGVAGIGVGAALLVQGQAQQHEARSTSSLETFENAKRSAQRFHAAGIATTAVGAALLVGGVIRYVVVARRPERVRLGLGTVSVRF